MKLHTPFCPECGEPATGTFERLIGRADFDREPRPDGEVEYSGWTEVWWDEQRTMLENNDEPEGPDNRPLVCCHNGHIWPSVIDR